MDFSISTVKMGSCYGPPCYTLKLSFPIFVYPLPQLPNRSFIIHAKKNPQSEPILKPSIVQEVSAVVEEEEELLFDDFEDGNLLKAFLSPFLCLMLFIFWFAEHLSTEICSLSFLVFSIINLSLVIIFYLLICWCFSY